MGYGLSVVLSCEKKGQRREMIGKRPGRAGDLFVVPSLRVK